jgi:hypothetical protein
MSEATETDVNVYESKAVTTEMTREEFMKVEHLVQTGQSDTLPGGKTVAETFENLVNLQRQQEKELQERGAKYAENSGIQSKEDFLSEMLEVSTFENGAVSARPKAEKTADESPAHGAETDIPLNFPGRKVLIARGLNLEKVSTLDRDALIAIDGIAEATADKILAYGKSE